MAGINPARYQDYVQGKISLAEASMPATSQPATNTGTSALRLAYDSRNAANSAVNPSTGYGGADYSKADSATQQGIQDNENRINTDPNFRASEIQRALQVRNERMSNQGGPLDVTDQNNYLSRLGYKEPVTASVTAAQPVQAAQANQPSNNSSLINDIYTNNYNAQAQKLKAARDQALAGLAGQDDLIKQNAISGLNNNDLMANQRMQSLKEAMANAGLSASGDNVSAQVGIGTSKQQGANDINTNRGNLLNQSMAQRNAINNNSSADDLALMQQLQAVRGGQLLDDSYKNRQYGLDLADRSGQLPGGGQTLSALNADRNYQLGLSGLSGQLPSSAGGGQTLAALQQAFQQRQGNIGNALSLSQLMGQLYQPKDSGSELFGQTPLGPTYNAVQDAIKNGMSQQQIDNQASQFAKTLGYNYENMNANDKRAWAQIAVSQQNADTSASNSKADNARADNAVNLSANQRKFAGDVQNELSQAKSRDDVVNFFNANAGEITSQLGNDAFTKMKNDALAQYDKVTPSDKQDLTSHEKAIAAAQRDTRWDLPKTDKNALIREYEAYYK